MVVWVVVNIIGIMACSESGVIGKNGRCPWYYLQDLEFFRSTIGDAPIIMGAQTYLNLPPIYSQDRVSIVFSKKLDIQRENIILVRSITEFVDLDILKNTTSFMIGGGIIAELFLLNELIEQFFITEVCGSFI